MAVTIELGSAGLGGGSFSDLDVFSDDCPLTHESTFMIPFLGLLLPGVPHVFSLNLSDDMIAHGLFVLYVNNSWIIRSKRGDEDFRMPVVAHNNRTLLGFTVVKLC